MTNVSINQGSKLGGQVVRVFSPNADLGGTADSTISAAKCFIGGEWAVMVYCHDNAVKLRYQDIDGVLG